MGQKFLEHISVEGQGIGKGKPLTLSVFLGRLKLAVQRINSILSEQLNDKYVEDSKNQ